METVDPTSRALRVGDGQSCGTGHGQRSGGGGRIQSSSSVQGYDAHAAHPHATATLTIAPRRRKKRRRRMMSTRRFMSALYRDENDSRRPPDWLSGRPQLYTAFPPAAGCDARIHPHSGRPRNLPAQIIAAFRTKPAIEANVAADDEAGAEKKVAGRSSRRSQCPASGSSPSSLVCDGAALFPARRDGSGGASLRLSSMWRMARYGCLSSMRGPA